MLMCELIKLSGDLSLTPTKILTSWGTAKMRTIGLRIKKQILESSIHRNRRARRRLLLYKPTVFGRDGDLGNTKH